MMLTVNDIFNMASVLIAAALIPIAWVFIKLRAYGIATICSIIGTAGLTFAIVQFIQGTL